MDNTNNYKSQAKDECRSIATELRGKPSKFSICFPSEFALDTKQNFKTGNYDKKSRLIPVECQANRRPTVDAQVAKLTKNAVPALACTAHAVPLEKYLDLSKGEKLDYTFYDICGNVTAKIARWFFLYQPYFADGFRLPFTMQATSTQFKGLNYKAVEQATDGEFFDFVHKFLRKQGVVMNLKSSSLSLDKWKSIYAQIYMLICSMPNKDIEFKSFYVYNNGDIVEKKGRGSHANDMVFLDIVVKDRETRNKAIFGKLKKIVNVYNSLINKKSEPVELKHRVRKNAAKPKLGRPKKAKAKKTPKLKINNAYQLARQLGIFGKVTCLSQLKPQQRSHIKIQAKRHGLDADKVVTKIQKRLERYGLAA